MPSKAAFGAQPIRDAWDAGQRALAAITYFLPFADSLRYGESLFSSYPIFDDLTRPLAPAVHDFHTYQYGSLLAFFVIFLGIVMNNKVSRFARFNAMQALVLEVVTITPTLLGSLNISLHGSAYSAGCSFLWLFVALCVFLGVFSSVLGTYIRLPFVTEWAGKYFP